MSMRTYIAILVLLMINALLFAVAVLSMDSMNQETAMLLPVLVLTSFAISPFISWRLSAWLKSHRHHHDAHAG